MEKESTGTSPFSPERSEDPSPPLPCEGGDDIPAFSSDSDGNVGSSDDIPHVNTTAGYADIQEAEASPGSASNSVSDNVKSCLPPKSALLQASSIQPTLVSSSADRPTSQLTNSSWTQSAVFSPVERAQARFFSSLNSQATSPFSFVNGPERDGGSTAAHTSIAPHVPEEGAAGPARVLRMRACRLKQPTYVFEPDSEDEGDTMGEGADSSTRRNRRSFGTRRRKTSDDDIYVYPGRSSSDSDGPSLRGTSSSSAGSVDSSLEDSDGILSSDDYSRRRKHRRQVRQRRSKRTLPARHAAGVLRRRGSALSSITDDDEGETADFPSVSSWKPSTRKRNRRALHLTTSSMINAPSTDDDMSDDDRAPRKRRRKRLQKSSAITLLPSRSSMRQSVRMRRVNYAQLGAYSSSSSSEDDMEDDDLDGFTQDDILMTGETSAPETCDATQTIDKVLGYRLLNSQDETSITPLPCLPNSKQPPSINDVEFFIKWVSTSHLHNTWESLESLKTKGVSNIRKIENFIRRMEQYRAERYQMTEDEIEQKDIALELRRQIDLDCLIAERVVAHRKDEPKPAADLADASKLAASPIDQFYVKWRSAPYDQCTWETGETLRNHGFQQLIDEFWETESRIVGRRSASHPLHNHALSRTSFEPYTETPFYLRHQNRELRDYQVTGINWMISRMKKGLSVLLADEMGLGKTVQTISVIGHMMFAEMLAGPYLVVVPQSTADNWLSEFRAWLPDANVVVYHGNPTARQIIWEFELCRVRAAPFSLSASAARRGVIGLRVPSSNTRRTRLRCDVCICTPSILNNADDLEVLRSIDWYFMAIDEAHLLKNRESRRFRELNLFKTRYRLLLSGTPLHNNLEEMWSLLHFLCPRIYEELDEFKRRFSEIEQTDSVGELKEAQLATLQQELHELVLRRVKKDVEKSLPKKVERILRIELSPHQTRCCKAIIARNYEVLARSTGTSKASLQNICMELKKACNHPLLLQTDADIANLQSYAAQSPAGRQEWHQSLLYSSGKLALLDKFLPFLREKGHRVLIFSQMVRMLNILSSYLTLRGFKHQRLDGTMSREVRKKAMDHFNAPDSDDFCFLLSTKAGGLGINLTSADTVILYDSDWNPQNDLQAEARAHRIGQTKTVQIYRLVTKDTIEERILERAKAKMVLDTLVVQSLNKRSTQQYESRSGLSAAQGTPSRLSGMDGGTGAPGESLSPQEAVAAATGALSSVSKEGFGFSRDELTRILKFGATKLWRESASLSGPSPADGTDSTDATSAASVPVDLDKILAEAEEQPSADGAESLADELFSSFTNISDFRYEAPPDPSEFEDKDFWEKAIPKEDRLIAKHESLNGVKDSAQHGGALLLNHKRHRRPVQRTGVVGNVLAFDDDYSFGYADKDDDHDDDKTEGHSGGLQDGGEDRKSAHAAATGGTSRITKEKPALKAAFRAPKSPKSRKTSEGAKRSRSTLLSAGSNKREEDLSGGAQRRTKQQPTKKEMGLPNTEDTQPDDGAEASTDGDCSTGVPTPLAGETSRASAKVPASKSSRTRKLGSTTRIKSAPDSDRGSRAASGDSHYINQPVPPSASSNSKGKHRRPPAAGTASEKALNRAAQSTASSLETTAVDDVPRKSAKKLAPKQGNADISMRQQTLPVATKKNDIDLSGCPVIPKRTRLPRRVAALPAPDSSRPTSSRSSAEPHSLEIHSNPGASPIALNTEPEDTTAFSSPPSVVGRGSAESSPVIKKQESDSSEANRIPRRKIASPPSHRRRDNASRKIKETRESDAPPTISGSRYYTSPGFSCSQRHATTSQRLRAPPNKKGHVDEQNEVLQPTRRSTPRAEASGSRQGGRFPTSSSNSRDAPTLPVVLYSSSVSSNTSTTDPHVTADSRRTAQLPRERQGPRSPPQSSPSFPPSTPSPSKRMQRSIHESCRGVRDAHLSVSPSLHWAKKHDAENHPVAVTACRSPPVSIRQRNN